MGTRALVTGGGGFIGGHLVRRLLGEGNEVTAVDIKPLEQWMQSHPGALNVQLDLMDKAACLGLVRTADVIYHLAADVGGVGYITCNDWRCASSSRLTQNLLEALDETRRTPCFFFASSACVYPIHLQSADLAIPLQEGMAYPAQPEGGYGWAKLYSELLCGYAARMGVPVRIARFFNVYGPSCDYQTKRAKAPAALSYKFTLAKRGRALPLRVWGDGKQLRSFLYIEDCLDAIEALMRSGYAEPVNVASDEVVTISEMASLIAEVGEVRNRYEFSPEMPTGVSARIPCIDLARKELGWLPKTELRDGLRSTYEWISGHVV